MSEGFNAQPHYTTIHTLQRTQSTWWKKRLSVPRHLPLLSYSLLLSGLIYTTSGVIFDCVILSFKFYFQFEDMWHHNLQKCLSLMRQTQTLHCWLKTCVVWTRLIDWIYEMVITEISTLGTNGLHCYYCTHFYC